MDEEQAINMLPQKKQKKIKPKTVNSEKHERNTMEKENILGNKGIEYALTFEKEDVLRREKQKERNKEKKRNRKMCIAGEVDPEKNGGSGLFREDCNVDTTNNYEVKKTKKMKKKKEEASIHKVIKDQKHDDAEKREEKEERYEVGTSNVNVEHNERKKRKREGKKNKDYDGIGWQDTCSESILESKLDDSTSDKTADMEDEGEKMISTLHEGLNDDSSQKIKKKKKKKMVRNKNDDSDLSLQLEENMPENVEASVQSASGDNKKRKKFKKKENFVDDPSVDQEDINMQPSADETHCTGVEDANKRKKKKAKHVEDGSNDRTPNRSNKKVRFSDRDEVFPLPDDENGNDNEEKLVRGKRFTKEEDEIVKEAVMNYINEHDLGEEGLDMVLNSIKHPEVRGCWKEIATAIPYRPYSSVYNRAQVLYRRSEKHKWTEEEYEMIRKHQEVHGNRWKDLADELGNHRWHVKDTWRRIKFQKLNKGQWSQEEYQKLFDLVNVDLQLKITEEKKSKHGMLRDNICWTAISDRLTTRSHDTCCLKWYRQLTSPMVAQGLWADADDYRMLSALYSLDESCVADVDWDNLLDNRSGDVCRQRWNQMVLHIGHHGNQSFAEQVEVLARRYCSHLIEARETWDNKPRVS